MSLRRPLGHAGTATADGAASVSALETEGALIAPHYIGSVRPSTPENRAKGRLHLLFVVGRLFRLRLGAALGLAGERAQQLFLGHLTERRILTRVVGVGPRL